MCRTWPVCALPGLLACACAALVPPSWHGSRAMNWAWRPSTAETRSLGPPRLSLNLSSNLNLDSWLMGLHLKGPSSTRQTTICSVAVLDMTKTWTHSLTHSISPVTEKFSTSYRPATHSLTLTQPSLRIQLAPCTQSCAVRIRRSEIWSVFFQLRVQAVSQPSSRYLFSLPISTSFTTAGKSSLSAIV
jgi:hypothetical protein